MKIDHFFERRKIRKNKFSIESRTTRRRKRTAQASLHYCSDGARNRYATDRGTKRSENIVVDVLGNTMFFCSKS